MTSLAALAVAGCLAVDAGSDRITLGDLAAAFPGFAADAADTPVAFAPAPGVRRIFPLSELRRLGARLAVAAAPERELCFERPLAPLDPASLLEAMRKSLPGARIEVLDYSRAPAPRGQLEFPPGALRRGSAGAQWNGSVRYAGQRRFAVWARVRVTQRASRVVAAVDLKPGRPVEASQLRTESRDEMPGAEAFAASGDQIAGRVALRPVAAGTALRAQWFAAPPEVSRGDKVKVEVWSGGAHLEVEARAEASGTTGQTIPVRNLDSQKRFFARVLGKGKVSVGL
jgi:flagella basal body P-ring formation protein FlgA